MTFTATAIAVAVYPKDLGRSATIAFADVFYDALGADRDVEFAFKLGCSEYGWKGLRSM